MTGLQGPCFGDPCSALGGGRGRREEGGRSTDPESTDPTTPSLTHRTGTALSSDRQTETETDRDNLGGVGRKISASVCFCCRAGRAGVFRGTGPGEGKT